MAGGGGEFCCKAAYPSPQTSLLLGRLNLHVFRMQNTRFDIIGGALYFLLVVGPSACARPCRGVQTSGRGLHLAA